MFPYGDDRIGIHRFGYHYKSMRRQPFWQIESLKIPSYKIYLSINPQEAHFFRSKSRSQLDTPPRTPRYLGSTVCSTPCGQRMQGGGKRLRFLLVYLCEGKSTTNATDSAALKQSTGGVSHKCVMVSGSGQLGDTGTLAQSLKYSTIHNA